MLIAAASSIPGSESMIIGCFIIEFPPKNK